MFRTLALATLMAGAALPALAQNTADKAAMIAAITDAGCRVDGGNNAVILAAAKLNEDAARAVVDSLIASGEAKFEGGVLVLTTGGCG